MLQVLDITEKSRTEKKGDGGGLTNEQLCIIYAICHVTGMLSACANPVIIIKLFSLSYLSSFFTETFLRLSMVI